MMLPAELLGLRDLAASRHLAPGNHARALRLLRGLHESLHIFVTRLRSNPSPESRFL